MTDLLASPDAWVAFLTLTLLELVLGIDNVVFLSILVDRLPPEQRSVARRTGLLLAMGLRIALLFLITWLIGLTAPLLTVAGNELSGRDLILLAGGAFLIAKSTREIHELLEGAQRGGARGAVAGFWVTIAQILAIDMVFSFDSILTAVGIADDLPVMVAAVVVSVFLMMAYAEAVGRFVGEHPTLKMLALAFLVVIGVVLVADAFDVHVPRSLVYSAMVFSLAVELLNLKLRKGPAAGPVELRHLERRYEREGEA